MFGPEALDIFFSGADAVECILPTASTIRVLLDSADDERFDGRVMSGSHVMTGKTSDLQNLNEGDLVKVDERDFSVRYGKKVDDGKLMEVILSENE